MLLEGSLSIQNIISLNSKAVSLKYYLLSNYSLSMMTMVFKMRQYVKRQDIECNKQTNKPAASKKDVSGSLSFNIKFKNGAAELRKW